MSEEKTAEEGKPRGLYERLKTDDTGWELWAKIGVVVLVGQMIAFAIAFARIGQPSVYAWSIVIPMMGFATFPLTFWGLIRAIFRPPVFRMSRTWGFLALIIVGFFGNAPIFPAPVSTMDWQSEHTYYLPFDGEWATLAGGKDKARNHHAVSPSHRFAYSFVPVMDGKRYEGDGTRLEEHYCFGRDVHAPAAGMVIQAMGGEEDHQPGSFDPNRILGNHVVIQIDEGEYLFMAHMRRGSLKVRPGDQVEQGQLVGQCGNSGRSFTPHLHVHLQNSRAFPMAEGLPLRFSAYYADGEPTELGMPRGVEDVETELGTRVRRLQPIQEGIILAADSDEESQEETGEDQDDLATKELASDEKSPTLDPDP